MGSSSSFLVGLLNVLNAYENKKISKKNLAYKSIKFEQKILKEKVGSQDQIAATYGGFNSIKFFKNNTFQVNSFKSKKNFIDKLSRNLILVYTGINRTAHNIANSFVSELNKKKVETSIEYLVMLMKQKKLLITEIPEILDYFYMKLGLKKKSLAN